MDLEQRVCCLELSKKLKKLGVPQDSYWYWARQLPKLRKDGSFKLMDFDKLETARLRASSVNHHHGYKTNFRMEYFSAFTVGELGEKLKEWCKSSNFCPLPLFDKQTKKWNNQYADDFIADTEANARAQLFDYLINDGTIKIKKLKARERR